MSSLVFPLQHAPKRLLVALAAGLVALCALPWVVTRLGAASRQVRVVSIDTQASLPAGSELKVMTWNIAHGRGLAEGNWEGGSKAARELRLDSIAEALRAEGADVVVLNEVDFDSSWSGGVNQAEAIAQRAGYPYVVEQRNLDTRLGPLRWAFGNAVLSRYPIADAEVIDLPAHALHEAILAGKKRGVLVTLALHEGRRLQIAAVHLEHRLEEVRVQGAREIVRQLKARALPTPTLVVGDLNSAPEGDPAHQTDEAGANALHVLLEEGGLSAAAAGRTFPADAPRFVIDWILTSPELSTTSLEVVPSLESDHRPVLASVRFVSDVEESAAAAGPAPDQE
jgi:endonuclease/exonuclease/phosphatase family metal-dependent hydrolase